MPESTVSGNGQGEYSMRVVTRITGLPADTIRTWERRYRAVEPDRTPGGSRRYRARDVRRLNLLRKATERGHRIRDIARRSERELRELSEERELLLERDEPPRTAPSHEDAFAHIRRGFLESIERFDARRAGDILTRASTLFPTRDFLFEVVLPIMRETGDRWERGELSIAHEHLITMQVRGLLESLLRLASPLPGAPRMLAATPAGHDHEFGALAGALLAASRGLDAVYLGADLPEEDLALAVERSGASLLLLSIVRTGPDDEMLRLAEALERLKAKVPLLVGTSKDHPLTGLVEGVTFLHRYEDLELALTQAMQRRSK